MLSIIFSFLHVKCTISSVYAHMYVVKMILQGLVQHCCQELNNICDH